MTFLADITGDPEGFLSTNAANFSGPVLLDPGVSGAFTVQAKPTFQVRYRTGSKLLGMGNAKAAGRAFEIKWKNPNNPPFGDFEELQAVWSGYQGGLPTHCDLPAAGGPDLMFTPRADGCTLTVLLNAGSARFGHYNLKDGDATLDAGGMVEAAEAHHPGQAVGVFTKEYYYSKAKRINATTGDKRTMVNAVGVRSGGVWRFFVQYLESKGPGYQIRGVEELRSGVQMVRADP